MKIIYQGQECQTFEYDGRWLSLDDFLRELNKRYKDINILEVSSHVVPAQGSYDDNKTVYYAIFTKMDSKDKKWLR